MKGGRGGGGSQAKTQADPPTDLPLLGGVLGAGGAGGAGLTGGAAAVWAAEVALAIAVARTTIELRKSPKNDKKLRVQLGGKPMLRN